MGDWTKAISAMLWIGLGAWGIPKLGHEGLGYLIPTAFVVWIGGMIYGLSSRRLARSDDEHDAS